MLPTAKEMSILELPNQLLWNAENKIFTIEMVIKGKKRRRMISDEQQAWEKVKLERKRRRKR